MLGSSQLDIVIGLDIHMEIVPTSPAPVPFPMPFLGLIEFTPFGTLLSLGISQAVACVTGQPAQGPVLINMFPATKTGDEATNKMLLPHIVIPPGIRWMPIPKAPIPFLKPGKPPKVDSPAAPAGDAVLITGSKTVHTEGANQCRLGDIALSCSDPVRLPSSVLLPIPKGMPVLVGGPPALDWATALKTIALRNKWTAGALHQLVSRLPPGRLRNLLHKGVCTLTGHPVDVATGRLLTDAIDFELDWPIPLAFERNYCSAWAERDSPLGHGWSHSFDERIWLERGKVVYLTGDGREIEFSCHHLPDRYMREEQELWYPIDQLTLRCVGNGRWTIRSSDGLVREFEPVEGRNGVSMIRRIVDRVGHTVQFDYASGLLDTVTTSESRWIRFEHRDGLLTGIMLQHPDGDGWYRQVQFSYSPERDLTSAADSYNRARTYKYQNHLLVEERDRDNVVFWFEYDGRDSAASCVRTWGTDHQTTDRLFYREITYDKKGLRTFVEDSLGALTTYVMNPAYAVVEIIDATGSKTKYEYNEHFWKTAEIDALGNATRFTYDARGNETSCTLPSGGRVTIEYNAYDQPLRMVDLRGVEWWWLYDGWGRVIQHSNSTGEALRYEYDGRVLRHIVRSDDRRITLQHDSAENLVRVTSWDGTLEERWYDRHGRISKVRDAAGQARRFGYDFEGRLIRVEETGGILRQFEHSGEGDLVAYQDNLHRVRFGYCGFHKVWWQEEAGERVTYRYSSEDHLVEIVNELGESYSFVRDDHGRVTEERSFDGRKHMYRRDALGRVVVHVRPSMAEEKVTYDAAWNVTAIEYADGSQATFEYDPEGELTRATNASGTVTWDRDQRGRILKESFGADWIASTHDAWGQRAEITSSRGLHQRIARTVAGDAYAIGTFRRDIGGVPRPDWGITIARDAIGRETQRMLPGGVVTRDAYDDRGTPVLREVFHGQQLLDRTALTWDGDERLRQRIDHGTGTTEYAYDARGRLDSTRHPDRSIQVRAPGPTGNLYRRRDRTDREYLPGGLLRRADGTIYEYTDDGGLSSKQAPDGQTWTYRWNGADELDAVTCPDGTEVTFGYDALGRRVWKRATSPSGATRTTHWRWDGNVPVHEWVEGDGAAAAPVTWLYEPETFSPIAKFEGAKRYSVIANYLGTPEQLVDEAGKIAWKAQLDVYGVPRVEVEDTSCPWRWPGQYEDTEIGLVYNRFRYYDPSAGQYISQDPLGTDAGLAMYAYVPDPNGWVDILGLALSGVSFAGSPDLYPVDKGQKNVVRIPMQGSRGRDFTEANKRAGLAKTPKGYTWHHVNNFNSRTGMTTMQLVKTSAHEATFPHMGSVAQFEKKYKVKYDSSEAVKLSQKKGWLKGRPPPVKKQKKKSTSRRDCP